MAEPLQRGRFGTRNLQMITIIQIEGLPAKRAIWDSKFVNNNDHPNWRAPCKDGGLGQQICKDNDHPNLTAPSQKTVWDNKFANNNDFPYMASPLQSLQSYTDNLNEPSIFNGDDDVHDHYIDDFLTVDWVSWCAAHCNIIVIILLGVTGSHSSLCQRPHGPRPPLSRDSTPSGLSSFWTSYRPTFCIIGYLDMGQVMAQGALASSGGTFDKSSLYVSWQDNGN